MKVIKTDYANVKVIQNRIHFTGEQKQRIIHGIELVGNNSRYAKNKDAIGFRMEILDFFDMLHENEELSDRQISNIDINITKWNNEEE